MRNAPIVSFVSDIDYLITKKVNIRLEEGAIVKAHMDTGDWTYHSQEREKYIGGLFTGLISIRRRGI
jgi:hypothetical protein